LKAAERAELLAIRDELDLADVAAIKAAWWL
jgi:hypothetical protein